MDLVLRIPDEIVPRLNADRAGLERRALEALALEEYRSGRISDAQLSTMLGFSTVNETDGFLKEHGVPLDYTMDDLERDRETLGRLGL